MLILVNLSDFKFVFSKQKLIMASLILIFRHILLVCILLYSFFKKIGIIFIQYIMFGVSSYSISPMYPTYNKLHTFFSNNSLSYIHLFATLFIYRAKFLKLLWSKSLHQYENKHFHNSYRNPRIQRW